MLQNAYFLAKIGADTAENEQHFAEILPKIGNDPTGRGVRAARRAARGRAAVPRREPALGPLRGPEGAQPVGANVSCLQRRLDRRSFQREEIQHSLMRPTKKQTKYIAEISLTNEPISPHATRSLHFLGLSVGPPWALH